MDFAVALHADLIAAVPGQAGALLPEPDRGHVEVPPEDFWALYRAALLSTGARVAKWRDNASAKLVTSMGAYKAPLTWASFGDAVLMGGALPFLGVAQGETWVPVSLRSGPGVIIDHWAEAGAPGITAQTHKAVGRYVADRLRHVVVGPMKLMVTSGSARAQNSSVTAHESACALAMHRSVADHNSAWRGSLTNLRINPKLP